MISVADASNPLIWKHLLTSGEVNIHLIRVLLQAMLSHTVLPYFVIPVKADVTDPEWAPRMNGPRMASDVLGPTE